MEPNLLKRKGPLLVQGALCIRGTQLYRGAKGTQPDPSSRFSAPNSAVSLRTIFFYFLGGIFRILFLSHLRPSCIPVSFLFLLEFPRSINLARYPPKAYYTSLLSVLHIVHWLSDIEPLYPHIYYQNLV